jgi:hypothetical protein
MNKMVKGSCRNKVQEDIEFQTGRKSLLSARRRQLFTVTRNNPMLIVFDTRTGKVVIGGEGFVSVVQQMTPDRYGLIANVPTKVGARTGYFDVRMDRLYVGVQAERDEPAEVMGFEAEDY